MLATSACVRKPPVGVTLSASVPRIHISTVKSPAPTSAGVGGSTRTLMRSTRVSPPVP
jgi:hypothetical protein